MPTGVATSYDLTVGVVVDMDEAIYMQDPIDAPLINGIGSDGLSILATAPTHNKEFFWMHDGILTPRSLLAGAIVTADVDFVVQSGDRTKFSTGDLVFVAKAAGSEYMRVASYGTTADTLVLTRAYSGSATTYASGSVLIGLGTALAEGSDPEAARTLDRTEVSNYTQIFGPTSIHMSRTEQQIRKYGVSNEFARQVYGRTAENAISRDQAYLYGVKTNSTTTKIRTTAGMKTLITTNTSAATEMNVTTLSAAMQTVYAAGGNPNRLLINPVSVKDLNDIGNTSVVRVDIDDARRGRQRVSYVMTEFGDVTVVRDRNLATNDAFLFRRENAIRRILQPLIMERLAKTGDSDKAQIVAEEGLEFKGQRHAYRWTTLTYT